MPLCVFCGTLNTAQHYVCNQCKELTSIEQVLYLWKYNDPIVRDTIAAFKYHGVYQLAPLLAAPLARLVASASLPTHTIVVPVPLSRSRKRERGFNQAELIAKNLGLPIGTQSLVRVLQRSPQAHTESRGERFRNVENAFEIHNASLISGRSILLVDDVVTTGATLTAAARVLKEAGAEKISAAVLAHG